MRNIWKSFQRYFKQDKCYHTMVNNRKSGRNSSLLCNVTVNVEVLETSIRILKYVIRRIHVEFVSIHDVESTDREGLGLLTEFLECLVFLPVVRSTGKVVQLKGKQPEIHQQVRLSYWLSLSIPSWRCKFRLKSHSNFWYSVVH